MSQPAEVAVAEAMKVAEWLDANAEPKRANDVRRICRSNQTYRGTLKQLHRDNMDLRREIEVREYHSRRIAEIMGEGDGFWRACSGCQESSDGCVSTEDYPYSKIFRCQPGSGCGECGGLGVLWDDTDYEAYAKFALDEDQR
jgi:hypothetical protein